MKQNSIKKSHARNARSALSSQCFSFVLKIIREGKLTMSTGSTFQVFSALNLNRDAARTDVTRLQHKCSLPPRVLLREKARSMSASIIHTRL